MKRLESERLALEKKVNNFVKQDEERKRKKAEYNRARRQHKKQNKNEQ